MSVGSCSGAPPVEVMQSIGHHLTMVTLLLWLLCACLAPARGGLERSCPTTDLQLQNRGICGNQLSDILKLLCGRGGYHKRSLPEPVRSGSALSEHLFLSKRDATSYLKRVRPSSYTDLVRDSSTSYRGIVCECCHHSCSIMELSQYCLDPENNLAKSLYTDRHIGKRTHDKQKPLVDEPRHHSVETVVKPNVMAYQKMTNHKAIETASQDSKTAESV